MDQPFRVMSGDVDATWSDSHVIGSDDHRRTFGDLSHSTSWIQTASGSNSRSSHTFDIHTISHMSDGQLSPISNGIDIPGASANTDMYPLTASSSLSSAPTLDNSTTLSSPTLEASISPSSNLEPKDSCTGSSSYSHGHGFEESHVHGHGPDEDAVHNNADTGDEMQWDVEIGDDLAIPKMEPIDDDNFCLSDLEEAPAISHEPAESTVLNSSTKVKRPRGRPRKLSTVPAVPAANGKVAKGRSKTGCITCRKRKKKCDEAKPRCELRTLYHEYPVISFCFIAFLGVTRSNIKTLVSH